MTDPSGATTANDPTQVGGPLPAGPAVDAIPGSKAAKDASVAATRAPVAAVLALGFGAAVAMWAIGYVGRFPGVEAPPALLGILFLVVLVVSGAAPARLAPGGVVTAALCGVVSAGLNLLILGSLKPFRHEAGIALPGSLLAGALLAGAGAFAARAAGIRPGPSDLAATGRDWLSRFGRVACVATLLLLAAGGLVTSHDAGLAVPDWPRSYGSNMFLFPLERMTGGVYYEHAHRLFGALVGLTTLTFTGLLLAHEPRRRVRAVAVVAFFAVVAQGILGGLRVDSNAMVPGATTNAPRIELAVVHGILAQLFFSTLVGLTAVTSSTWRSDLAPSPRVAAATDRLLQGWLIAALVLQLLLGALVRHVHIDPSLHITNACAVAGLAGFAGVRAWGLHGDLPVLRRVGGALATLVVLQLLLGIVTLVVTNLDPVDGARPPIEVPIATAHQTIGALLLALTVLLRLWTGRLLTDPPTTT